MMTEAVDEKTGMTESQMKDVEKLWRIVRQNQKTHGLNFYQRLMTQYPEYQSLFTYFKEKQLDQLFRDRDPRLIVQALRVMRALDFAFMSLDKPEIVIDFCYQLGHRHLAYGLQTEHFQTAKLVMITSLSHDLGNAIDDENRLSLKAALDFIVSHIIRGLEDARQEQAMASRIRARKARVRFLSMLLSRKK